MYQRYSDQTIEEVRSRNDIVDVIGSYVSLKKKGNSYSACCPFHHEKTPSFHVSRDKQMYHCFGCGVGGNVLTFVMEYENFTFPEALRYLAERAGISLPEQPLSKEQKAIENYKQTLKEINRTAAGYFHYLLTKTDAGKKALDYFHNRGLSDETIYQFGLGYSNIYENDLYQYLKQKGYTDQQLKDTGLVKIDEKRGGQDVFWNRAMVPILDINGKVIGFGGRVLGDGLPKYINTKETEIFDKSHTLFAMHIARRSKKRGLILCEGYMDVIALHEAGYDNAVASLGTALTMGHASIIKRYTQDVYLAYDSDGAGRKATLKAIHILREVGLSTRVIDMTPYKDPDEFIRNLGKDAFEERIQKAVTGIVFEIDTIAQDYDLKDPEGKVRFTKEAAKRLSLLEEPVVRHSYMEAVAEKYHIELDGFKAMITSYGTLAIRPEVEQMQTTVTREKRMEDERDAQTKPQRLLLTWLVGDLHLFEVLDGIVTEEDFVDEDYRAVAHELFEQFKTTGEVKPASIVNLFDDVEKQHLVAKILQTELNFEVEGEEKERAINDVVRKVKMDRIDYELAHIAQDPSKLSEIIARKGKLSKLHISLKNG
ncbi:MAG: DNA primase [Wujia sp.]